MGELVRLIAKGISDPNPEISPPQPFLLAAAMRSRQGQLGYVYVAEMDDYLLARGVNIPNALANRALPSFHPWMRFPSYHLLEAPANNVHRVIAGVYRAFGNASTPAEFVDVVEAETALGLHAKISDRIGTGFSLTAGASKHGDYKRKLNVTAAGTPTGAGSIVAILDSGADRALALAGWRDLTRYSSPTQVDNHGHGTAMAAIVRDIASGASCHAIRVTDSGVVHLWDLMAGLKAAAIDIGAHIISMSLGIKSFSGQCSLCGQGSNQSTVFEDFFVRIAGKAGVAGEPDPIFLASVGNDGGSGFHWPAAYNETVAVGAVTLNNLRPAFSNTGTTKLRYFLCPGGDVDGNGDLTEWVGEGQNAGNTTYCAGTSPAAAYAAGVLALYREYRDTHRLTTSSIGILDRASNLAQPDVSNEVGNVRLVYGT